MVNSVVLVAKKNPMKMILNQLMKEINMKTYKRTVRKTQIISDGKVSFELKKGEDVITSQTKKGECHVFSIYWFLAPSKWFNNVRIFTK